MSDAFFAPLAEAFSGWNPAEHPRGLLGRFRRVRFLGGTTGATLVQSKQSGKEYVAKGGNHEKQIRSEYAANRLYEKAGVPVPKTKFEEGHQLADYVRGEPLASMLTRTASGWEPRRDVDPERWANVRDELAANFAVDAWLANWDVLGLEMDNVLVPYEWEDRKDRLTPLRVDNGGSLAWRAQGEPKGEKWGPEVAEIESLRKPGRSAAVVFGGLSDTAVADQIRKLPVGALRPEIERLRADGMLSKEDADVLQKRLSWLREWADRHPADVDAPTEGAVKALSGGKYRYSIGGEEVIASSKVRYEAASIWRTSSGWAFGMHKKRETAAKAKSAPGNPYLKQKLGVVYFEHEVEEADASPFLAPLAG